MDTDKDIEIQGLRAEGERLKAELRNLEAKFHAVCHPHRFDPFYDRVCAYIGNTSDQRITTADIFRMALDIADPEVDETRRLAPIMRELGWRASPNVRNDDTGRRVRGYYLPVDRD